MYGNKAEVITEQSKWNMQNQKRNLQLKLRPHFVVSTWANMKTSIKETAYEEIRNLRKERKEWMTGETLEIIEERRKFKNNNTEHGKKQIIK